MFPTLGDLLSYLLHAQISMGVSTFGFFMALSFLFAYFVFQSEFRRKEKDGTLHHFLRQEWQGLPPSLPEISLNFAAGFILGFKLWGLVSYRALNQDPLTYLISWKGSWIAGSILGILWAGWSYADRKKAQLPQPKLTEIKRHPYQLMPLIVVTVTFWGFIGAKLFDMVDHLSEFRYDPVSILFSRSGLAYYGGLVFGGLSFFYIGYRYRIRIIDMADIGSPGMMLAYGVGRIGCHLAGDGDWGINNIHPQPAILSWLPPWVWSFRYPHNIIDVGMYMPGCVQQHCFILPAGVYPTPLYEAVVCITLFFLLWLFRYRIKTPGLMFSFFLILCGLERIVAECIRVTPRYQVLHINFSQAQLISACMLLGGLAGLALYLYRTGGRPDFYFFRKKL
jgi:phosphatidylglycerol:prolipoprotein diacylglycerol transferase